MLRSNIVGPAALVAMLAVSVVAAAFAGSSSKPSFVDDGTLAVCVDPTFPPMEFVKAGSNDPVGVDIDVAKVLSQAWSAEMAIQTMDFNGLLPSLSAGRCDTVISGIVLTEERQKTFDAVGYLNTFIVIVGKSGAKPLSDMADLAGKSIAVQSGTTYAKRMETINEKLKGNGLAPMTIQQYPKQTDAIQQLEVGRVDGVVTQDTEVAFREFENPGKFATIWTVPQEALEPYAVYFRKSEADKAAVQEAVSSLLQSGQLNAILDTWKLSPKQLEGIN